MTGSLDFLGLLLGSCHSQLGWFLPGMVGCLLMGSCLVGSCLECLAGFMTSDFLPAQSGNGVHNQGDVCLFWSIAQIEV